LTISERLFYLYRHSTDFFLVSAAEYGNFFEKLMMMIS